MEGGLPIGFILILFGLFAVALAVTVTAFVLRQWRVNRLKDPRRDYYRHTR